MRYLTTLVITLIFTTVSMAQTASAAIEKRVASDVEIFENKVAGEFATLRLTDEQKEKVAAIYRDMYAELSDLDPYVDGKREVSRAYRDAHAISIKDATALLTTEQRLSFMRNTQSTGK